MSVYAPPSHSPALEAYGDSKIATGILMLPGEPWPRIVPTPFLPKRTHELWGVWTRTYSKTELVTLLTAEIRLRRWWNCRG